MRLSLERLFAGLVLPAGLLSMAAYDLYGTRQWQLSSMCVMLGVTLLLLAIELGWLRRSSTSLGHLLHLRCQRHPSVVGYCGYESDFQKFYASRRRLPEVILLVANRHHSGRIYAAEQPARHHHLLALMGEYGDCDQKRACEQGFLTSHGRYVDRVQAWAIAQTHGQIKHATGGAGQLFSENLWAGPLLSQSNIEDKAWELIHAAHHSSKVVTISIVPEPGEDPSTCDNMVPQVRDSWPLIQWRHNQAKQSHG